MVMMFYRVGSDKTITLVTERVKAWVYGAGESVPELSKRHDSQESIYQRGAAKQAQRSPQPTLYKTKNSKI